MRLPLTLHPDSHCTAVDRIEVEIARPRSECLILSYVVTGTTSEIRLPPTTAPARGDALWRHTCFETFVRASSGQNYYEFNFSPSGQWAAYRFTGYRNGMCVADEISAAPIEVRSSPARCTLQASLALDRLSALPRQDPWRLGFSVVIEDARGGISYWALAHPPGKPDFHHTDGFVHELARSAKS